MLSSVYNLTMKNIFLLEKKLRESLNKFPEFFFCLGHFIGSTHMKL